MNRFPIITLIFLLLSVSVLAQKHRNIWCFGFNAGLDFNMDPPTAFRSEIFAFEGSSSVSDPSVSFSFIQTGNRFGIEITISCPMVITSRVEYLLHRQH